MSLFRSLATLAAVILLVAPVDVSAAGRAKLFTGRIVKIEAVTKETSKITVLPERGMKQTVQASNKIEVRFDGQQGEFEGLREGMKVSVFVNAAGRPYRINAQGAAGAVAAKEPKETDDEPAEEETTAPPKREPKIAKRGGDAEPEGDGRLFQNLTPPAEPADVATTPAMPPGMRGSSPPPLPGLLGMAVSVFSSFGPPAPPLGALGGPPDAGAMPPGFAPEGAIEGAPGAAPAEGEVTITVEPTPAPLQPKPPRRPDGRDEDGRTFSFGGIDVSAVQATPAAVPAANPEAPVQEQPKRKVQLAATPSNVEAEWSQFRGPNRDNIAPPQGLAQSWPEGGPKLDWTAKGLGLGYSTVALAHGKLYTMGDVGEDSMVLALDPASGDQIWAVRIGASFPQDQGNGPRGTPTIDGDRLYALGAHGDLCCLDANTGEVVWQKNILSEFGAVNITWGISESVLIDGEKLICTPGGKGAAMVALDKNTGDVIWKAAAEGDPAAAYSSAIIAEIGGVRQYINFTHTGLIGVRAEDGKVMWKNDKSANGTANCSTPVLFQDGVFSASGYGTGGALVYLISTDGETTAVLAYHTKHMKNHHGGMIALDGFLYGSNDPGTLTCIELATGEVKWRDKSVGKGSLAFADGLLVLRSEEGPIALIEANPEKYVEKGRFDQPERSENRSWAHPVIAGGKLYLRDMDVLLCYDIRSESNAVAEAAPAEHPAETAAANAPEPKEPELTPEEEKRRKRKAKRM